REAASRRRRRPTRSSAREAASEAPAAPALGGSESDGGRGIRRAGGSAGLDLASVLLDRREVLRRSGGRLPGNGLALDVHRELLRRGGRHGQRRRLLVGLRQLRRAG